MMSRRMIVVMATLLAVAFLAATFGALIVGR
jgi:hypothetical protein